MVCHRCYNDDDVRRAQFPHCGDVETCMKCALNRYRSHGVSVCPKCETAITREPVVVMYPNVVGGIRTWAVLLEGGIRTYFRD